MVMANTKARFAFVLEYVSDIDAAKRFFVDVLGLELERDHPTFAQFKAGDGARYAIATDERMEAEQSGQPELWWVVEDAAAAFEVMSRRARVSLPPRQMPFGTCFGIEDPTGQAHYLLEFAPQRPSQQVS
jgi:predicted enzyme related to lactoylglutathione lyase